MTIHTIVSRLVLYLSIQMKILEIPKMFIFYCFKQTTYLVTNSNNYSTGCKLSSNMIRKEQIFQLLLIRCLLQHFIRFVNTK